MRIAGVNCGECGKSKFHASFNPPLKPLLILVVAMMTKVACPTTLVLLKAKTSARIELTTERNSGTE